MPSIPSHLSIHPSTSALIIAINSTTTTPATTTTATTATTATITTTPITTPTPTSTPTPTPNATSLSLPCLFPYPPTRTPTPTPIPISTTASATASALWVFRTVSGLYKLILLPNLKSNAFTHGSLLSLLDLLLPPALPPHPLLLHYPAPPLPPLPLVHLGISALAFKSNCTRVKGQKRVRNPSETRQIQPSISPSLPLSLSFSLSLPLPFFPCPATRTPSPIPTPTPTLTPPTTTTTTTTSTTSTTAAGTIVSFPDRFGTARAYFVPKFEIECVHAWILII